MLDRLTDQLDALRPDNMVVGLTGGSFVCSGPKVLEPDAVVLEGRTF